MFKTSEPDFHGAEALKKFIWLISRGLSKFIGSIRFNLNGDCLAVQSWPCGHGLIVDLKYEVHSTELSNK